MDNTQDSDTFSPMPQAIKKTKGRWRTKKTVDGKNVHIPLFGRKKKANNTVDKGEYANAYIAQKKSYMQYQFDGDIGAYTTALASILSGEATGVREYRQMLGYLNGMHQTILNGMNLATFHDLMLSNPRIEKYLLDNGFNVKDATGKSVPLANLKVFDGSSISGTVNIVTNGNNGKNSDLFSIARLEVIPLTDKIYMSLSSKGGFYYREGDILIPFDRLTEQGFLEEVGALKSNQFITAVKSDIEAFNQQIITLDSSGVAAPGMRVGADGITQGMPGGTERGYTPGDNPNSQSASGGSSNSKEKPQDKDIRVGYMIQALNTSSSINEFEKLLKESPVLYGQMAYNGFTPSDNDRGAIPRFYNALESYALITGNSPKSIVETLDDPAPDDTEKANIADFFNFARSYNSEKRAQTLSGLIKAFMVANNIPPGSGVIPDDPYDFYQKVIASNDPATAIYRNQWMNFVNPENAKNVSALYQLVTGRNPGYDQYSQATGNAGYNTGSSQYGKKQPSSSMYDQYGNLRTDRNKQAHGSKWDNLNSSTGNTNKQASGAKIYTDEEISRMKSRNTVSGSESKFASMGGSGKAGFGSSNGSKFGGNTVDADDFGAVMKRKIPTAGKGKYDLQVRMRNEILSSNNEQVKDALDAATREVNDYLTTKVTDTPVAQFLEDYIINGNPRIAPYLQGNRDAGYVDADNVLNAFARRLGLSTNTGNADFDAYRTVD